MVGSAVSLFVDTSNEEMNLRFEISHGKVAKLLQATFNVRSCLTSPISDGRLESMLCRRCSSLRFCSFAMSRGTAAIWLFVRYNSSSNGIFQSWNFPQLELFQSCFLKGTECEALEARQAQLANQTGYCC